MVAFTFCIVDTILMIIVASLALIEVFSQQTTDNHLAGFDTTRMWIRSLLEVDLFMFEMATFWIAIKLNNPSVSRLELQAGEQ